MTWTFLFVLLIQILKYVKTNSKSKPYNSSSFYEICLENINSFLSVQRLALSWQKVADWVC